MSAQKKKNITLLAVLFTVCGVLLLAVAVGSQIIRCRALELRLDEVFIESLSAHTTMRGKGGLELISDTQILLEDATSLLEGDSRPLEKEWVTPLLSAMSLGGRRVALSFLALEDMGSLEPGSEEQRVFLQALDGSEAVSDIIPAQVWTESYFLVVQPVKREGRIVGAVEARVSADLLSRQGHDSTLFLSVNTVIAEEDGRVAYGSAAETRGLTLAELGMEDGLSQGDAEEFIKAYEAGESGSFCYDLEEGRGYTAWAAIGCNGWRVVQFSQSADLRIEHSSMVQTVVTLVSLLVCAVLAALIWRQRARLAKEKLRYSTLSEFKDTLIFEYDCQNDSMEFTSNALDTLELERAKLDHVTSRDGGLAIFHPDDMESVQHALQNAGNMVPDQVEHDRVRMKKRGGEYSRSRSQYKAVFSPEGKAVRLIGTMTDISAQINREIELRNQAQQDPLTGVYNRAGVKLINARLEQISRGILFMMDLDDFKFVNDTYGHAAGDRLLMAIGGVLRDTFRTDDIVARVGGDEFVAFLSGSDSRATAEQKGQELLERVRELRVEGVERPVTVSVGAASAPALGRTYEALSLAADEAMYQVKHSGKGGFIPR